jgi:hypothetical protein
LAGDNSRTRFGRREGRRKLNGRPWGSEALREGKAGEAFTGGSALEPAAAQRPACAICPCDALRISIKWLP